MKDIDRLKRCARKAYERHCALTDKFSCGANLAAHISPDVYQAAREFNSAMAELRAIDSSCPDFKPLPEGA